MTAVEKPGRGAWSMRELSTSEDDTRLYLGGLKPFRLAALQHDPDGESEGKPERLLAVLFTPGCR